MELLCCVFSVILDKMRHKASGLGFAFPEGLSFMKGQHLAGKQNTWPVHGHFVTNAMARSRSIQEPSADAVSPSISLSVSSWSGSSGTTLNGFICVTTGSRRLWGSLSTDSTLPVDRKTKCVCRYKLRESLHGLNYVTFSRKPQLQIGSCAVVCVAILASVLLTAFSFSDYLARQTATLVTIRQKHDLRFPNITLCPKNPDAINLTMIKQDIITHLTGLNGTETRDLIAYSIAGFGFDNMDVFVLKYDEEYRQKLRVWFDIWLGNRTIGELARLMLEDASYKCEDLMLACYYAGDEIPCCDIFHFSYVMLRGRCLKLREFYQEDVALTGTISMYMAKLPSSFVTPNGFQPQTILYISDEYPDVATFPRFYLEERRWNQLHLTRRVISMLPDNPQCSNSTKVLGAGTCFVDTWLSRRVVQPLNCTLFYLRHKYPHLRVCHPAAVVASYKNVINLALDDSPRCLPACFRRDVAMSLQVTKVTPSLVQDMPDSVFQLEFAYDALQEEMFQEIITTTVPGFIAEIGGGIGLFLGISISSLVQLAIASLICIKCVLSFCKFSEK